MKTPVRLKRPIAIQGWRVTGTIAFATQREWEPALLKLAVERGGVNADTVVSELLGGRSGVARRLLEICTRLGLLEAKRHEWLPTAAGRLAAQSGLVLVPERGTWTLWGSEDPLLPSAVIAAVPWKEPSAYDERGNDPGRTFRGLPTWLTATVGRVVEPIGGNHRALRIDDLGKAERGEPSDAPASLSITLTVAPEGVRVRVSGAIDGDSVDADVRAPTAKHDEVWTRLLRQAGRIEQWDTHRQALWVSFKATSAAERSSMVSAVRFTRPDLTELGRFDDATVEPVDLRPLSTTDAAAWAEWRLVQGIKTYLVDGALEAAYRDAAAPFADMAPTCPARADLASRARGDGRPPPQFWKLQAPADWSLDGRRTR